MKRLTIIMKREKIISKNKLPVITAIHFRFIKLLNWNLLSKWEEIQTLDKLSKCKNNLISLSNWEINWRKKWKRNSTVVYCTLKHRIRSDYHFNLLDNPSSQWWKNMKKGLERMLVYLHLKRRLRIGKEEDLMIFHLFYILPMRISVQSNRTKEFHKLDERKREEREIEIEKRKK